MNRPSRPAMLGGGILAVLLVLLPAGTAAAHPLGNFTYNQYSGLEVAPDEVRVDYVLDMAEIPTFQSRKAVDRNADGRASAEELAAAAQQRCAEAAESLELTVSGQAVPLSSNGAEAVQPAGQAGLPTTRITCELAADVEVRDGARVSLDNDYLADRVGWREIAAAGDGMSLSGDDVRSTSVSKRLTAYPEARLQSPLDERSVTVTASRGGAALSRDDDPGAAAVGALDAATRTLNDLVGRQQLGLGVGLLAVGLSLLLGALHAFAPGHGKTVMAAYLVGRNASLRAALTIGATVTITHTAGVLVLGVVLSVSTALAPEQIYPYLGLLSGLLLAAIGLQLVRTAIRRPGEAFGHSHGPGGHSHGPGGHSHGPGGHSHGPGGHSHGEPASPVPASRPSPGLQPSVLAVSATPSRSAVPVAVASPPDGVAEPTLHHDHDHDHDHEHHDHHDHGQEHHDHGHGHGHEHHDHGHADHHSEPAADRDAPPSRRSLIAMGMVGGMVPTPSALVVLLGAIALHRAWFGVLLVLCYGIGMAATLTAAGVLLSKGRDRLSRRSPGVWGTRLGRALPVGTAALITLVGIFLAIGGGTAILAG